VGRNTTASRSSTSRIFRHGRWGIGRPRETALRRAIDERAQARSGHQRRALQPQRSEWRREDLRRGLARGTPQAREAVAEDVAKATNPVDIDVCVNPVTESLGRHTFRPGRPRGFFKGTLDLLADRTGKTQCLWSADYDRGRRNPISGIT
jgi:hypothetical protein